MISTFTNGYASAPSNTGWWNINNLRTWLSIHLSKLRDNKVERTIRNMTTQRKNSLFFCSDKGARNSAIYNTFISTCRQVGVSFRDYFRKLMKELGTGRTDYENLLPMTIGVWKLVKIFKTYDSEIQRPCSQGREKGIYPVLDRYRYILPLQNS